MAIVRRGRLVALEDVPTLLARRKRNVEMRLDGPPPALDGVAGVIATSAIGRRPADAAGSRATSGRSWPRSPAPPIHDLTIEPARLEEAFLEFYDDDGPTARPSAPRRVRRGRARVNRALFAHTWRANRTRALIVAVALAVWGTFLPIIYDSFGSAVQGHLRQRRASRRSSPSSAAATSSA